MIEDRTQEIAAMRERWERMGEYLRIDAKRGRIGELETTASEPGFWDDQNSAQATMAEAAALRDEVAIFEGVGTELDDIEVAMEFALEDDDETLGEEVRTRMAALLKQVDGLELSTWLSGEFDHGDAILTIIPGAGGLESQDWAEMLMKMLVKYAENRGWKIDLHDAPKAVELGIERALFTVHGRDAYGLLSSEHGVHRLVRISPTDEKKRRHTTFAKVEVLPVIPREVEVDIRDEDVRVDVYRSSGPGGQSVNTTDSAVRLTHVPTGIVVTCQNEKSQHKNKDAAMTILKARLYELEQEKLRAELEELKGEKQDIAFGSQIRSYVLYPYQMVKDHRTDVETGNVDAVLAGDLDDFIVGFHRWRVGQEGEAAAVAEAEK